MIYDQADDDANIILGSVIDPAMNDEVIVTVVATGCGRSCCAQKSAEKTEQKPEPIQPSIRLEEPVAVKPTTNQPITISSELSIDLNDIDVPTFMRNRAVESDKVAE